MPLIGFSVGFRVTIKLIPKTILETPLVSSVNLESGLS